MNKVFLPWDSLGFQPVGTCQRAALLRCSALNLLSHRVESLELLPTGLPGLLSLALTKRCLEALYTVLVVASPVLPSPGLSRCLLWLCCSSCCPRLRTLSLHASDVLLCRLHGRSQPTTGNAHSLSRAPVQELQSVIEIAPASSAPRRSRDTWLSLGWLNKVSHTFS